MAFVSFTEIQRFLLDQQQVLQMWGLLVVPQARQWLLGLQAPLSDKEKPPAAAHAAADGPQDQQALVACGASTLKTLRASKCKQSFS
ncbi:hypothetical protein FQA47_004875 [Oryzias melastigma]|uniref:Uncharacterized protein n=1 Tax=Oryzias melastigma TaxID=30732 RepID=A0A834FSA8_ORYME|nr:hypothetical protein FQA47_004875 [Oryzias melastigma]